MTTTTTSEANINLQMLITSEKNPRGIPACKFIVSTLVYYGEL